MIQHYKKIAALLCLLILTINGFSQSLKKITADKFFNQLAYIEAVEYYKDLVKQKNVTEDDLRHISLCYYYLSDYKNAEIYYKELSQKFPNSMAEADLLNYIQVLKYNQKYDEAKTVLNNLQQKNQKNKVVINHNNNPGYINELKTDSTNYTITNVEGINTEYSDHSPTFIRKKKIMTFSSNRKNNAARNKTFAWDDSYFMDLWHADKKDSTHFDNVMPLPKGLTSLYHDGPMVLSTNEKTMYITRSNYINKKVGQSSSKTVNLKLFIMTFDSAKNKWSDPVNFEYNSDEYSIGHAAISKDGKRLYFVSDMPGGYGQTDLYVSEYKNDKWQKPENLGQTVNTEGREMFPYVYEDGTLFFSTDGRAGLGGLDVYFSPINLDQYFEPQNLGYPLNTNMDDFGFYLNTDLLTGYVSSNRANGKGKDDIYFFKSKKPILGSKLTGIVYDENTKEPIKNAYVYLVNKSNTAILDSAKTDSTGRYIVKIKDPSKDYKLAVRERSKYYDKVLDVKGLNSGDNVIDVYLYPKYKMICTVYDADSKQILVGVKATLMQKTNNNEMKTYFTNDKGEFSDLIRNKKVNDMVIYEVKFEKEGYVNTVQHYEIKLDTNTVVVLNEKLICVMQKLEVGNDISKAIKIDPIYFDYGKFNIRPEAAIELDKIVALMKQNPTITIELGSHTDCRSSKAYNLKLSDKRAKSSANYIISKGIEAKRITGKGYGESKLINKCECEGSVVSTCTEEEHQANRRTEFIIVKF